MVGEECEVVRGVGVGENVDCSAELMSQSIPSRMTKQKHHLPWITRSIIRLQRKRDKAHSQAKKTK